MSPPEPPRPEKGNDAETKKKKRGVWSRRCSASSFERSRPSLHSLLHLSLNPSRHLEEAIKPRPSGGENDTGKERSEEGGAKTRGRLESVFRSRKEEKQASSIEGMPSAAHRKDKTRSLSVAFFPASARASNQHQAKLRTSLTHGSGRSGKEE